VANTEIFRQLPSAFRLLFWFDKKRPQAKKLAVFDDNTKQANKQRFAAVCFPRFY